MATEFEYSLCLDPECDCLGCADVRQQMITDDLDEIECGECQSMIWK